MRVEALVRRRPVTIRPGATIKDAAELFVREKVGLIAVCPPAGPARAEAVVSERDVVRAVAAGTDLGSPLEAVSSKKVFSVRRSDRPSKAAKLMMEMGVRHLVVENDDGTLFGVLSIRDFFSEERLLKGFLRDEAQDSNGTD